jgi:hypothetical protein
MDAMKVMLDDAQSSWRQEARVVQVPSLSLNCCALECGRSCDLAHSDHYSNYCHGDVFQQQHPVRNQPWPSTCAQMPNVRSRDNTQCPDADR